MTNPSHHRTAAEVLTHPATKENGATGTDQDAIQENSRLNYIAPDRGLYLPLSWTQQSGEVAI